MSYEFELKELPAQPVMSARGMTSVDQIARTIGELLGEVWGHIVAQGGHPVGPPFTRYHRIEANGEIELEGGLPVASALPSAGRVHPGELPAGEAISTIHVGRYEGLVQAGAALEQWALEHGREGAGPNWESYVTDPGADPDPATWRTLVVKPLQPRRA